MPMDNCVYIVMYEDGELKHICAIFSNDQRAKKYLAECNSENYYIENWLVDAQ